MSSPRTNARVISVNLAQVRSNPYKHTSITGIDKRPAGGPVHVRAPGTRAGGLGSGLEGDTIGDRAHHGGDDQAVYAYAREDLDHWQEVLGRDLPSGSFGENLTTEGIDINAALVGERWIVGDRLELQITDPRIPCSTFRGWIAQRGWLRTFTEAAVPGTYLRVVAPGDVAAGDAITVSHRPDHDVTVALVFRALTREPELLASILAADDLPVETRAFAEDRTFEAPQPDGHDDSRTVNVDQGRPKA
jgi:MOSC domain-containing protein YiiM